jgi:hypothetical protein
MLRELSTIRRRFGLSVCGMKGGVEQYFCIAADAGTGVGVGVGVAPGVGVGQAEAALTVNIALTDRLPVTDTVHVALAPEQLPPQPVNVEPVVAAAVRVTDVPEVYEATQVPPQLIPPVLLVTVPDPVPDVVTDIE